jgi:hypothetical protein
MRIHEILTERETTTSSSWEKSNTTDEFSQTGGGTRIDKSVDNPGRAEYFAKKRERDAQAAADTEARRQQFLKSKGLENASGREKRSAMDNARFSGEFTNTEPRYDDLGKDPGSHLEVTKKNVPPVNTRTVTSTATNSPAKVTTTPAPMPSAEISSDPVPAARSSTNFAAAGKALSPQTTTTTRRPPAKGRSADKWLDFTDTDNDPWLRDSNDDDDDW